MGLGKFMGRKLGCILSLVFLSAILCDCGAGDYTTQDSGSQGLVQPKMAYIVTNANNQVKNELDQGIIVNTITECVINSDGSLNPCQNVKIKDANNIQSITLNNTGTSLYLTDSTQNTVLKCNIESELLSPICSNVGAGFTQPYGIAANNMNSTFYVTNFAVNTVSMCDIKMPNSCDTFAADFSSPTAIVLNNTSSGAYITNQGNSTVSYCRIISGSLISQCNSTGSGFNAPSALTISAYLYNPLAFIVNHGNNTVSKCNIEANGSLSGCGVESITPEIQSPNGVVINNQLHALYIADSKTGVYKCNINSVGSLSSCTNVLSKGALAITLH